MKATRGLKLFSQLKQFGEKGFSGKRLEQERPFDIAFVEIGGGLFEGLPADGGGFVGFIRVSGIRIFLL